MRFLFVLMLFVCSFCFAEKKVVLISGGSGGIGIATAKAFQADGWAVWAGYRNHIPEELNNQESIHPIYLDVTDDAVIQKTINTILRKEGRIDALVNNAGYGILGMEISTSIEETKKLFDVNFFGCLRLIQAVSSKMCAQRLMLMRRKGY